MEIKEERAIFNIERKEAAAMIGVSMRTIDRYIRSGRLAHKKVGYNVFLAREELEKIIQRRTQDFHTMDVLHDAMQDEDEESHKDEYIFEQSQGSSAFETLVYKSLYEGAKVELVQKQKEIEGLSFRLGEVETKLQQSVPLLAYNEDIEKSQSALKKVGQDLQMTKLELHLAHREQKRSMLERNVYVGISVLFAFIILVLAGSQLL